MDEKTLISDLNDLKACLLTFNPENKILFYNKQSLYFYLENIKIGDRSAKTVLDSMYRAIPLLLTKESYDIFFNSSEELDTDKFEIISKAEFFELALKNIDKWDNIVRLCKDINKYLD